MEPKNKWIVGSVVTALVLLGVFGVVITDKDISVTMPSDVCDSGEAKLIVTKDDFRIKCGWKVMFQADTILEYFKTYGEDEWVRDFRYTGRNKANIDLELREFEDYFDIVRKTRYRKGQQYVEDGILFETYSFSKDKVKISYLFNAENTAKHRITMRIKKDRGVFIDAFDPFGHTGVLTSNSLYYEGYGDLEIDPSITLSSPLTSTTAYDEGDTIPLVCKGNSTWNETLTSITLYWTADANTWRNVSRTVLSTGVGENYTATFSQVIPHKISGEHFQWYCYVCNSSDCFRSANNWTVNPVYKPNNFTISQPDNDDLEDLNILNGTMTDWNLFNIFPDYVNRSTNNSIHINWTYAGHPDENISLYYNLSYFTTTNRTNTYFWDSATNASLAGSLSLVNLPVGKYYFTLHVCNELNQTDYGKYCVNDTTTNFMDIFDYEVTLSGGVSTIRFSPLPNVTRGAPYGQTSSTGIFKIDWLDYTPTGLVNMTLNATGLPNCTQIWATPNATWDSTAKSLTNQSDSTILLNGSLLTDPDYIWLFATKEGCSAGTVNLGFRIEVLD